MRSAGDDFQAFFDVAVLEGAEMLEGLLVHLDDGHVRAAHNQQSRRLHAIEHRGGEVRPPEITFKLRGAYDDAHQLLYGTGFHGAAGVISLPARASRSRISSSVVCEKSSYQNPTE